MFSTAYKKRFATAVAGAALASAMAVSGAEAHYGTQDLRSPDAVDAARAAGDPPRVPPPPSLMAASAAKEYSRLRSRGTANARPQTSSHQDLRSPDTRDLAEGYAPTPAQQPVADTPSEPGGFDLASAAIGAAAAAGLSLVLMATLLMRRPAARRPAGA